MIQARLRGPAGWTDAVILNISKRGMLVRAGSMARPGSYLEIRRGPHIIVAKVVWANGGRFGVLTQDPVPAVQSLEQNSTIANDGGTSAPARLNDRRTRPRATDLDHEASRWRASAIQFSAAGLFAVSSVGALLILAHEFVMGPLGSVAAVLGARD